jgi:queuine tRNA-ribosyltransferase
MLTFEVVARDGAARRGRLTTGHGVIETPAFFAVATRAALRGLDPEAAARAGVQALIANSYHLAVQPGAASVARAGGLHRFMGWPGVLATDSGGFQVFSLRHGQVADEIKGRRRLPAGADDALEAVHVDEDGADFRSYLDGTRMRVTPESSMALQQQLGADLLFCLDECTPLHVPESYTDDATRRNARWARRCLEAAGQLGMAETQSLYGIVHGGVYPELRRWSAEQIGAMEFDGLAIGDCLGETKQDWYGVAELVSSLLPEEKPRHLLGVGEPDDLIEGALRGIDSFDCAMPTRIARHGQALHPSAQRHRIDLATAAYRSDDAPIDAGCDCHTCARHTRAYLSHLFRAREALGASLVAEHNLRFTTRVLEQVREAISAGRLAEMREELAAGLSGTT